MSPATAVCGPYEIVARTPGTLTELADGSVELYAECSYRVRLEPDASADALHGALEVHEGDSQGWLRFRNYVGLAQLGPRTLRVRSDKLDEDAIERMLNEVCERFGALPFSAGTLAGAEYVRVWDLGRDALYHAFAFLRDGMRGYGRNDLRAAIERVLSRPHESMCLGEPRVVPVGAASRFEAGTLEAIQSEPELLSPLPPGSPLTSHPLAQAMRGAMPDSVRTRPIQHSTDNPENRFVVAALEAMVEVLRRVEKLAQSNRLPAAAHNAREARELADTLGRMRNHRVLEHVAPAHQVPLSSTVLRGRAGYRELLAAYGDLFGRTTHAEPHAAQGLLELRKAAEIYEYWCFFQVVAAVGATLGEPTGFDSFAVDEIRARVQQGYEVRWADATVAFNQRFPPRSGAPGQWPGSTSYSLEMRPDIALRAAGRLHLFDAKLKLASKEAGDGTGPSGFKSEDVHKMHAYRDALGADSAWVLYPGGEAAGTEYRLPTAAQPGPLRGVGAIPLRPVGEPQTTLADLVARLLA